jgi:hypothetical protein
MCVLKPLKVYILRIIIITIYVRILGINKSE